MRDILLLLTFVYVAHAMSKQSHSTVQGYNIRDKNDTVSLKNLKKLSRITTHLYDICASNPKYSSHKGIARLLKKFACPDGVCRIEEQREKYSHHAAYSIDKGRMIGVCMKYKGEYVDDNTMVFVYLHELAHVMSEQYSHDEEFWSNFAYLLEIAVTHNLYKYEEFHVNNVNFCGENINFTPYVPK